MPYRRGDVVLAIWPNTAGQGYKQRPALIVQADDLITGLRTQLCACITSTPRTGPSRVVVKQRSGPGQAMNLQGDSVIMADQLLAIPELEIKKSIGRCTIMRRVDEALKRTLDLLDPR